MAREPENDNKFEEDSASDSDDGCLRSAHKVEEITCRLSVIKCSFPTEEWDPEGFMTIILWGDGPSASVPRMPTSPMQTLYCTKG